MPAFSLRRLFLLTLAAGTLSHAADTNYTIKPDHPDGVYALNEKVTWDVDIKGGRATVTDTASLTAVPYSIKKDGAVEVASGTLDLSAGPAKVSATREEAGALVVTIPNADKSKPLPLGLGAAMFAPEKIGPSLPEPADFDAFWQAKLKDLAAVPINPVVEKVEIPTVKNSEGVDYYKVTLDNIKGTHVRGQLARPTVGDKFPAILMLQYAGVYALNKDQLVAAAKPGWLALNISAHDLPIDEPDDYYEKLKKGELKDYVYIGSESRETSYFLRMLLGCVRAQEYLATRPDWDGKTLVVTGTSQGGLQSFATAGLCPTKVTAMMVLVPAGCDSYATLATPARAFGWPYWLSNWGPKDRDMKKVQETAGYFDPVYFAARIKCPSLVAAGLLDTTARPTGIIAAYNAIKAPKELILMVNSDHRGAGGAQAEYSKCFGDWKNAIKAGKPLPMEGRPETPFSSPGK